MRESPEKRGFQPTIERNEGIRVEESKIEIELKKLKLNFPPVSSEERKFLPQLYSTYTPEERKAFRDYILRDYIRGLLDKEREFFQKQYPSSTREARKVFDDYIRNLHAEAKQKLWIFMRSLESFAKRENKHIKESYLRRSTSERKAWFSKLQEEREVIEEALKKWSALMEQGITRDEFRKAWEEERKKTPSKLEEVERLLNAKRLEANELLWKLTSEFHWRLKELEKAESEKIVGRKRKRWTSEEEETVSEIREGYRSRKTQLKEEYTLRKKEIREKMGREKEEIKGMLKRMKVEEKGEEPKMKISKLIDDWYELLERGASPEGMERNRMLNLRRIDHEIRLIKELEKESEESSKER